jgi:hypothetical protein
VIDSYDFGHIVIDGQRYTSDVIVFPDWVKADWWRKEGHQLHVEDIKEALEEKPNVLVVGTGYSGLVKVLPETEKYVRSRGVELIIQRTGEAYKTFNRLVKSGKRVIAAFHLTC